MKHIILLTVFALVFGLAAFAQTATPGQRSMPQPSNPTDSPAQPQMSPSQTPEMPNQNEKQNPTNGERKLKGCISSQGGTYTLQTKHGKEVALSGSADFASHVGHTVTVHGTYSTGANSATATPTASETPAGSSTDNNASGGQFVVSKIEMVSDTCKDNTKMKGDKGQ